ncbi:Olfactory receptor 867 [Fukomys damarensis]|uniref:Olfactory receptor 867 n=1 Tax=Fukomys damarensis TaxID=885580 RepID=A0A091DJ01_FUKDA|nr:Olfactory receptor 867 [Fukomys damarensis]
MFVKPYTAGPWPQSYQWKRVPRFFKPILFPGAAFACIEIIHLIFYHIFSARFIRSMELKNQTLVSEFILVGLTDDPEMQPVIFSLFLVIQLVTNLGILLIILAINYDSL